MLPEKQTLGQVNHIVGVAPSDLNEQTDQFSQKILHISGLQQNMSNQAV